jgi:hypothetical protein
MVSHAETKTSETLYGWFSKPYGVYFKYVCNQKTFCFTLLKYFLV